MRLLSLMLRSFVRLVGRSLSTQFLSMIYYLILLRLVYSFFNWSVGPCEWLPRVSLMCMRACIFIFAATISNNLSIFDIFTHARTHARHAFLCIDWSSKIENQWDLSDNKSLYRKYRHRSITIIPNRPWYEHTALIFFSLSLSHLRFVSSFFSFYAPISSFFFASAKLYGFPTIKAISLLWQLKKGKVIFWHLIYFDHFRWRWLFFLRWHECCCWFFIFIF